MEADTAFDEQEMDTLLTALANASRRRMLDIVRQRPGLAVGELAAAFDVSRIAVMKHLAVLEAAELLLSRRDGRTRRLYFNAVPIQKIHQRWSDEYSACWSNQLLQIKQRAEARHHNKPKEVDEP